ncbi:MAG: hypothetical protein KJT03_22315, partial [Verrucomicrobiae bacterium]|nr:hypothetical protein [Verrucomicrobiae bacterium]
DLVSKSDRSRKDDETILKAAEQFADQGKTIEAVSLYRQIYNLGQDVELRAAALRGEFALSEDKVAFVEHAIQEAPAALKDHAIRLVKSLPASFKKGKDLLKLPGLSDTDCIQILAQLAKRSDPSIHAEVVSYARSDSELFRTTALEALSQVGKPEDLPLLVEKVSNGSATEAKLAEEALYQIRGKQFDEAIVEQLPKATGKEQETLLRAVEKRNIESATPILLKLINGSDSKLASRALSTLTLVSGIPGLKAVVDQWIQENDDDRIKELDRAITRMTVRLQDNRETLGILKQAQSASLPETKKTTLMELLGKLEK